MDNFSFSTLKNLSVNDAKEYIVKYFIPLSDGNHAFYNNGKYEIKSHELIMRVYINKFPKYLKPFYVNEHDKILTPVYKLNKAILYDNNLNLCPQLPKTKIFNDLPDKDKEGALLYLEFMNEVLCSNKPDVFNHLKLWTSNMCKGNKNNCALIFKTHAQGVGK